MAAHADAGGAGEIPTFSGLPHERLEDYECDLKAYVLGTRETDRCLIGPRLLRRLGGLPGELVRRSLQPEDVASADGHLPILEFLRENGYQEIRVDRKSQVQAVYDRIVRHPRETVQAYFARENIAVADLLKERADVSADTRVHNMLGRSGLSDDRVALIYATCERNEAGELTPMKVQSHVIKLYNKPWRHGSDQGSRSNYPVGIYAAAVADDQDGDAPWWARGGDEWPQTEWNSEEPWASVWYGEDWSYGHDDEEWPAEDDFAADPAGMAEAFFAGDSDWIHRDALDEQVCRQLA